MRTNVELRHIVQNSKPRIFKVEALRQGGSLSARCGCGWYCMHNHKSVDQTMICVARHVIDIKRLKGEVKAKDLAAQWEMEDEATAEEE